MKTVVGADSELTHLYKRSPDIRLLFLLMKSKLTYFSRNMNSVQLIYHECSSRYNNVVSVQHQYEVQSTCHIEM